MFSSRRDAEAQRKPKAECLALVRLAGFGLALQRSW